MQNHSTFDEGDDFTDIWLTCENCHSQIPVRDYESDRGYIWCPDCGVETGSDDFALFDLDTEY